MSHPKIDSTPVATSGRLLVTVSGDAYLVPQQLLMDAPWWSVRVRPMKVWSSLQLDGAFGGVGA
jgi:hypothetical protein